MKFFLPAVRLLNSMKYPKKLTLIGVIFLLPCLLLINTMITTIDDKIETTQKEIAGLALIDQFSLLIQAVQRHQVLLNAYQYGEYTYGDELLSLEKEINTLIASTETHMLLEAPINTNNWKDLLSKWDNITRTGPLMSHRGSYEEHFDIISLLLELTDRYANDSHLYMDGETDTYYLSNILLVHLLPFTEKIGLTTGLGTDIFAKQNSTPEEKAELHALINQMETSIVRIAKNIRRAYQINQALSRLLNNANEQHLTSAKTLINSIDTNLLADTALSISADELIKLGDKSMQHTLQLFSKGSEVLRQLLQERIHELTFQKNMVFTFSIAVLLLILYLFTAFYLSTITTMTLLRKASLAFIHGDLLARVRIDSKDELSVIGESFNTIMAEFNRMLEERNEKEDELQLQKEFVESLIQNSTTPTFVVDSHRRIIFWNRACEEMTGCAAEDVIGTDEYWKAFYTQPRPCLIDAALDGSVDQIAHYYRICERSDLIPDGFYAEAGFKKLGGRERYIAINAAPIYNRKGDMIAAIETMQDIAENKLTKDQLRLADKVFETTAEGVIIMDETGRTVWVNPAYTAITGFAPHEIEGNLPPYLQPVYKGQAAIWQSLKETGQWQGEVWGRRKSGEIYPEWVTIIAIDNDKGALANYVSVFSDITELKKLSEVAIIEHLAYYDPLTELPNRVLFRERLTQVLEQAKEESSGAAVMFLDLDRFKIINDTLGHAVGDMLLQAAAARIKECLEGEDTIARMGGDEFTVIVPRIPDKDSVTRKAENIISSLTHPFIIHGQELYITTSIGISTYPEDGTDVDSLVKNADAAMYKAKECGRNQFRYYRLEMDVKNSQRLFLAKSLRKAIDEDQLLLYYQPQVDLQTDELTGLEALIRWEHPTMGLISPAAFIPLAEEIGLITAIDEWVLKTACQQCKARQDAGFKHVPVSVNVSAQYFGQPHLVQMIRDILYKTGLEPKCLTLEITESIGIQDIGRTIAILKELKDIGVQIAVDDFGTGFSSLNYLKNFPIHTVKIDQSFIRDFHSDPRDAAIIQTIISLTHSLNLKVIAEGVETLEQLYYLRLLGCDAAQGYYFSKPVSAKDLELILRGELKLHPNTP